MKIVIAGLAVILLCAVAIIGLYFFMPSKSAWADDYSQYVNTLANDDPLRATLAPMLADGERSIWEISLVLCGDDKACRLNNFTDVLLSPQSADMFAQTVLASLQHQP